MVEAMKMEWPSLDLLGIEENDQEDDDHDSVQRLGGNSRVEAMEMEMTMSRRASFDLLEIGKDDEGEDDGYGTLLKVCM
nr:hypothetical protein Itr_chr08CG10280 [Ipomoea trifida]